MKTTIFTLTSARSGTLYLKELFVRNVRNCVCRHEPFFDWGNPTLFGPAIYDATAGRLDRIRKLLAKKRQYVNGLPGQVYLESSHAFLKSAYVAALEYFPEMQLLHLVRDPLRVARSEAYREHWRHRLHVPFHYYWGEDGQRHFYWSLTTREEIFSHFDLARLSLFQRYLIQWIEIENRAMRFLEQNQLHDRCFTLHVPRDLNDPVKLEAMFEHLHLPTLQPTLNLAGRKNRSLGYSSAITAQEEKECQAVLERLPVRYLEILQHEPYLQQSWNYRFRLKTC